MKWLMRTLSIAVVFAACDAHAAPAIVKIHQYTQWCTKVEKVTLAQIANGAEQSNVLQTGTKMLADAARAAGARAIGIPTAENFTPATSDSGTLTVCAAVDPALKKPKTSVIEERIHPAETVAGVICGDADILSCQQDITTALSKAPWNYKQDTLDKLEFRIGPVEKDGPIEEVAVAALTNDTAVVIASQSSDIQSPAPRTFARWVVAAVTGK
ncbi:hypothetical protein BH10PSE7_BH10PSE7_22960 [soil metagenome]